MASFEVLSVDLAKLERAVGSRDSALVQTIAQDEDPPELRDAMRAILVEGRRPFRGDSYSLARVTLRMGRVLGRRINGNTCDLLSQEALDRVAAVETSLRLGVRFEELLATDVVPIAGLPIDEEMRFGVISADRIRAGFAEWSRARPADADDDDADGICAEMLDWLEVASLRGESLVGVFWP
ncbi:MAG: hypothetical protein U0234_28085 [Sandaracinus sp.]